MIDLSNPYRKNLEGIELDENWFKSGVEEIAAEVAELLNPTKVENISASQDVETDVKAYIVDTTSADVIVTFDLAVYTYAEGRVWYFNKGVQANKLIISVNGGTIGGTTTSTLKTKNDTAAVIYDGGTIFKIV